MLKRGSGLLVHLSSLPSEYGIGDLGPGAFWIADVLKAGRQRYWQMLPLNPTDGIYGESPYSSPSAFACNPLFISLDEVSAMGLLTPDDLKLPRAFAQDRVEFSAVRDFKMTVMRKAYTAFKDRQDLQNDYDLFCQEDSFWLDDYALFMALKSEFPQKRWDEWPDEIAGREKDALRAARQKLKDAIGLHKFLQYLFQRQWKVLRSYCKGLGLELIGDIPIYVNDDSVDVWANQKFFVLDAKHRPKFVAGVPPDYFSSTGQRWGNPVYDWKRLKADGFKWWLKRLKRQFDLFDIVRIDHFRGFESFWQIPAKEMTAVNGSWGEGPKADFLSAISQQFAGLPLIAEDLGIITEGVKELMKTFRIPGMKVLQFAFSGEMSTHPYIPENYDENCVVYTGTHDNNTTRGWFERDASQEEHDHLRQYLGRDVRAEDVAWEMTRVAFRSRAALALVPVQDILNLGVEGRMNVPGSSSGNWGWRFRTKDLTEEMIADLRTLTEENGRAACQKKDVVMVRKGFALCCVAVAVIFAAQVGWAQECLDSERGCGACDVLRPELVEGSTSIVIVPFSAGPRVFSDETTSRTALSIVKGMAQEFERDGRLEVLGDASAAHADLIVMGQIDELRQGKLWKRFLLKKPKRVISAHGKMLYQKDSSVAAVFSLEKVSFLDEGRNFNILATEMGGKLARCLMALSTGKNKNQKGAGE